MSMFSLDETKSSAEESGRNASIFLSESIVNDFMFVTIFLLFSHFFQRVSHLGCAFTDCLRGYIAILFNGAGNENRDHNSWLMATLEKGVYISRRIGHAGRDFLLLVVIKLIDYGMEKETRTQKTRTGKSR